MFIRFMTFFAAMFVFRLLFRSVVIVYENYLLIIDLPDSYEDQKQTNK